MSIKAFASVKFTIIMMAVTYCCLYHNKRGRDKSSFRSTRFAQLCKSEKKNSGLFEICHRLSILKRVQFMARKLTQFLLPPNQEWFDHFINDETFNVAGSAPYEAANLMWSNSRYCFVELKSIFLKLFRTAAIQTKSSNYIGDKRTISAFLQSSATPLFFLAKQGELNRRYFVVNGM